MRYLRFLWVRGFKTPTKPTSLGLLWILLEIIHYYYYYYFCAHTVHFYCLLYIFTNKCTHAHTHTHIFIHLIVCLTTGSKPLPKPALHVVQSRASFFRWQYPLISLRSSSSYLRLLLRLPVTSVPAFNFPSIRCCRKQFLSKMWPIQLAFRLIISCTHTHTHTTHTYICIY